jgi:TolA-binding protein
MDEEELLNLSEGEIVTPQPETRFWSKPLVLVLVSSLITATGMSVGWKASMDTFAAVSTVRMQQHDERISRLEADDSDRIRASDLAMRDQLLDAKLSLLQSEIAGLKEQISGMGRR